MVLHVDGQNGSYVDLGNSSVFDIETEITIEAWIKADPVQAENAGIITRSSDSSWRLQFGREPNEFEFCLGWYLLFSNTTQSCNDNQWHHLAGVYDGTTQSLYIDGILNESIALSESIPIIDSHVLIGATDMGNSNYGRNYLGYIDEVRIWNLGRSQEDIESSMNTILIGNENGLVGYWNFDDGETTDKTSNGNNGTMYGNVEIVTISTDVKENKHHIPDGFYLFDNYPNPFNPSTKIKYNLSKSGYVKLSIFNLSGQELELLENGFQEAGEHQRTWEPKGLPSGMFFYRLQAGKFSETKKLIFQK